MSRADSNPPKGRFFKSAIRYRLWATSGSRAAVLTKVFQGANYSRTLPTEIGRPCLKGLELEDGAQVVENRDFQHQTRGGIDMLERRQSRRVL